MKNGIILFINIIMCIDSFILDCNLSKSAEILGRLPLLVKTKFKNNKTKTKPFKILDTSCHFSLPKFCQVRDMIKKQTRKKCFMKERLNLKT